MSFHPAVLITHARFPVSLKSFEANVEGSSRVTVMEVVKKILRIIASNKTASLACFSTLAAIYLWKYREENELLHLQRKEQNIKLIALQRELRDQDVKLANLNRDLNHQYRQSEDKDHQLRRQDSELKQLSSKLKVQEDCYKKLQKEGKPVSAVYGFVALQRLEERTTLRINCIAMALERIPEFHSRYENLKKELERLQALDVEISGIKRAYKQEFGFSTEHAQYKNQEAAVLSQLSRAQTSGPCPLEEFLQVSPIENTFWNNGSASQKKKLERELAKLKEAFPEISENILRSTMVYAYSHFKRDIFSIGSRRLEKMVELLIYGNDEMANSGNAEEPELCSICLDEMNNTDIVSLVCNHIFHPECINPWLQRDNRCPLCRQSVTRNTQR